MKDETPEKIIRDVIRLCSNCDTCRYLMEEGCVFFPELYRLWDREVDDGIPISDAELRNLMELCTLCGICPCPKVPADIMEAKSRFRDKEGLPLTTRTFNDVPRIARLCGTFPRLVSTLQTNGATGPLLKKIVGVHPDRQFPTFPKHNFFDWAAKKGLTNKPARGRAIAYFAGCTAGYIFPEVGQAVVEVLQRTGRSVYVPPQNCCGMPYLVEGDRKKTLQSVQSNLEQLLEASQAGSDLVCSCPSCGYFMKSLVKEKACYSDAYQQSVGAGENEVRIPIPGQGGGKHHSFRKSAYRDPFKDNGFFASIDAMDRIGLADGISDVGEYLARIHADGQLDTRFNAVPKRVVYFAPCHQREQKIGSPYVGLLELIPGLTIETLGGMDCCGMGGNFGFKADFHDKSLAIGQPLMAKIREVDPQAIVTDCLSCRLQFGYTLPYPVFHPIEILAIASGVR
ncbi:MAG: heterodisulfide reductase-related iron-sulfur binding cluster [Desulfuromonadales bacterium]